METASEWDEFRSRMRMRMLGAGCWVLGGLLMGCRVDTRPPVSGPLPPAVADPPADHPLRAEILRGKGILEATVESLRPLIGPPEPKRKKRVEPQITTIDNLFRGLR